MLKFSSYANKIDCARVDKLENHVLLGYLPQPSTNEVSFPVPKGSIQKVIEPSVKFMSMCRQS